MTKKLWYELRQHRSYSRRFSKTERIIFWIKYKLGLAKEGKDFVTMDE